MVECWKVLKNSEYQFGDQIVFIFATQKIAGIKGGVHDPGLIPICLSKYL